MLAAFIVAFILCGADSAATVKTNHVNTAKINVGTSIVYQEHPDISGTRVVWQQWNPTTHKYSVWIKNIASGYKGRVMTTSQNQFYPKISGTWVVWKQVDSQGFSSIFCKNVKTGYAAKVAPSTANQYDPDISGGLIVWRELKKFPEPPNIHYKNIFTGKTDYVSFSDHAQIYPAVSGNRVVWMQDTGVHYAIYVKNIESGNMQMVLPLIGWQWYPAISGTRIVWDQQYFGYSVVYKNIGTGSTFTLQNATGAPAIDGGLITWVQIGYNNNAVHYCDVTSGAHGKVPTSRAGQYDPQVSGSRIVWTQCESTSLNAYIYTKNLKTGYVGRLTI